MNIYKVTRSEITVTHKRGKAVNVETNLLTSLWSDHEKALKHALWHCEDFSYIANQYEVAQVTGEPYKNVYVRVDEYKEENGRFVLLLNGTQHVAEVEDGQIYPQI